LVTREGAHLAANVPKYYIYQAALNLQFWMSVSILYLRWRGLSLGEIGLLETVGGLVIMLSEIPTGAIADLMGRRWSISMGMFLSVVGLILYGLADSFWLVALSYVPWMIGYTMTSGADSALLYDSLKAVGREDQYAKLEGRAVAVANGAGAVAGITGALVATKWGLATPIWVTAAVTFLGGLVALSFQEPPRQRTSATARGSLLNQFRSAAVVLTEQRILFSLMLFGALTTGVSFILKQSYFQVYAQAAGLPISFMGVLSFTLVGAGMIGASLSGSLVARLGEQRTLLIVPCLMGLAFLGMTATRSLPGLAFLLVVPFLSSALSPALKAAINRGVTSEVRATVLSTQSLLWALVLSVLSPLVGFIADRSIPLAFFALAAALLCSALVLWSLTSRYGQRAASAVTQGDSPNLPS